MAGKDWLFTWPLLIYGVIRIINVVVYLSNVAIFDAYRAIRHRVYSYRRLVICLLHNYFEVIFWFAVFYRMSPSWFTNEYICTNSLTGSLYYSVITISTLGYGDIIPKNNFAALICILETLVGIFLALVIFSIFVSWIPKSGTKDFKERNP